MKTCLSLRYKIIFFTWKFPGYGNLSPRTGWGKFATVVYAIAGMPLFLLYLSNIGDILARSFKWAYYKMCLCRGCPGSSTFRRRRVEIPTDIPMARVQPPQDEFLPHREWQVCYWVKENVKIETEILRAIKNSPFYLEAATNKFYQRIHLTIKDTGRRFPEALFFIFRLFKEKNLFFCNASLKFSATQKITEVDRTTVPLT